MASSRQAARFLRARVSAAPSGQLNREVSLGVLVQPGRRGLYQAKLPDGTEKEVLNLGPSLTKDEALIVQTQGVSWGVR